MKNVHKMTEGAILLAIYAVLLLITLYVPVLGFATTLVLSVPFILFAAKNNVKYTLAFFAASVFLSAILGTILAIPVTFMFGLTGVVMGYMIGNNRSRFATYSLSSLVFLLNVVVQYAIAVAFFKFNFIDEMIIMFQKSFQTSIEMLNQLGQAPDEKMIKQFEEGISLIETLVPSLLVISSFTIVFILQLVSNPIIKRFGVQIGKWKPFREVVLPKSLLWYYLIALIAGLVMKPEEGTYWFWALVNLVYILQLLMVVQGLSFVFYASHAKNLPKAFPIIITVLTFVPFIPVVLYIIRILGIIDLGFDLRKKLKP